MTALPKHDDLITDERGRTYYRSVPGHESRVCWWYDRQQKLWCVQVVDAADTQRGGSQHVPRSSLPHHVSDYEQLITEGREPPIR